MAINDYDGTSYHEIGKVYDYNGTTYSQIGKVYDNNGTTSSLIYSASVTVTLTNYGIASKYLAAWSSLGDASSHMGLWSGSPPSGRFWLYAPYGGWAYAPSTGRASASCGIRVGSNVLSSIDIMSRGPTWPATAEVNTILNLPSGSYDQWGGLFYSRSNSPQGGVHTTAQSMVVPVAPLESALGRQVSVSEVASWFGYGWTGSKTVEIQV